MRDNCHYDNAKDKDYIEISANTNNLKSEMILRRTEADFKQGKIVNSLLGCHSKLYTWGFNESENMVSIFTINSILVNIHIISGSYVNGSHTTHNLLVLSGCVSRV